MVESGDGMGGWKLGRPWLPNFSEITLSPLSTFEMHFGPFHKALEFSKTSVVTLTL